MALLGCGKHQAAQTSPPAPPADSVVAVDSSAQNPAIPAGVPGDPPPEVRAKTVSRPSPQVQSRTDNVIRQTVVGIVEPTMTAQLQRFVAQKGRLPDNFAEFANTRLDTVPRPPEGMRWVIDAATAEVKAVPK
jgi:hypothetical protein